MIAISDTSPLLYLVWIQHEQFLPRLFDQVLLPPAVVVELEHPKAPDLARNWIANPPSWVVIRAPSSHFEDPNLGPGEVSAIALAMDCSPCQLLMDDRDGVAQARQRGVSTIGTLGVLLAAAQEKWISLDTAIASLRSTTFRMSESLVQAILASMNETPPS
jgi:predicted nucleic acid-binding protein